MAHHLILIHGAWATPSIWETWAPYLKEAGFTPHSVSLPGDGVADDTNQIYSTEACVERVAAVINALDDKVSIVAHSGAGVIATALGEHFHTRIIAIIYIAGMMLPSEMGFAALVDEMAAHRSEDEAHTFKGIVPYLKWDAEGNVSTVPVKDGARIFFNDLPEDKAIAAAKTLVPQPLGTLALVTGWSKERFGRIPRLYIEASQDLTVVPEAQKEMQKRVPGAEVVVLDSGHVPQLSQPVRLCLLVRNYLSSLV